MKPAKSTREPLAQQQVWQSVSLGTISRGGLSLPFFLLKEAVWLSG